MPAMLSSGFRRSFSHGQPSMQIPSWLVVTAAVVLALEMMLGGTAAFVLFGLLVAR